jgi:hypothetical protein
MKIVKKQSIPTQAIPTATVAAVTAPKSVGDTFNRLEYLSPSVALIEAVLASHALNLEVSTKLYLRSLLGAFLGGSLTHKGESAIWHEARRLRDRINNGGKIASRKVRDANEVEGEVTFRRARALALSDAIQQGKVAPPSLPRAYASEPDCKWDPKAFCSNPDPQSYQRVSGPVALDNRIARSTYTPREPKDLGNWQPGQKGTYFPEFDDLFDKANEHTLCCRVSYLYRQGPIVGRVTPKAKPKTPKATEPKASKASESPKASKASESPKVSKAKAAPASLDALAALAALI